MPESISNPGIPAGAALALYNLLLPPGLLLAMPGFLLKMKKRGGYGPGFGQRFARYDASFMPARTHPAASPVWVHAVSVGEVLVAKKLICELLRREPGLRIVLSTTTSTGHEIARQHAPRNVEVIYNPLDLPHIVHRAIATLRPRALVLVEAEIWPNLVNHARRSGIPVLLVNARLSPRSARRYLRFRSLVAPVFNMLTRVCVQEAGDVARWTGLGVARERITCTGSIKFDQSGGDPVPPGQMEAFRALLRQLWGNALQQTVLLASSHEGEEAAVGKVIVALRERFPDLKFLVAPRHFERAAAVERDLSTAGLRPVRRSVAAASPLNPHSLPPDTLIIDTTGELRAWQALPDLVIIGKSLLATGGQNPVEAIAAGTAVITGPHMENFSALMALLRKRDGAVEVSGMEQLGPAITRLLDDPESAREMVARARKALDDHSGATGKTAALVLEALHGATAAPGPGHA